MDPIPFDPAEVLTARETFRRLSALRRASRQRAALYGPTAVYPRPSSPPKSQRAEMINHYQEQREERAIGRVTALFQFQEGCCYLCRKSFGDDLKPTIEHVTPKARGGRTRNNILLACSPCNNAKGDRKPTAKELAYLAQANDFLRNMPDLQENTQRPHGSGQARKQAVFMAAVDALRAERLKNPG